MPGSGWDAVLPQDVLTRLSRQHPNMLLVGSSAFTNAALKLIDPRLPQPAAAWTPYESRCVPGGSYAALIIHGVDRTDGEQQTQLCEWFDTRARHVQVVSTSAVPLYPMVEAGSFLERLYYRLNHVCLMADAADHVLPSPEQTKGFRD